MLTKSQKAAFKVIKVGFSYFYKSLAEWDLNQSQLIIVANAPKQWIYFTLSLGIVLSFAITGFYVLLTHLLVQSRKNYDILMIAIHFIVGIATLGIIVGVFIFFKEPEIIYSTNQLIILNQQLHLGMNRCIFNLF